MHWFALRVQHLFSRGVGISLQLPHLHHLGWLFWGKGGLGGGALGNCRLADGEVGTGTWGVADGKTAGVWLDDAVLGG